MASKKGGAVGCGGARERERGRENISAEKRERQGSII